MKRATRKGAGVLSFVRVDGLRRRERERGQFDFAAEQGKQKQKPSDTGDSRAIPQPSTNPAQPCLGSMF